MTDKTYTIDKGPTVYWNEETGRCAVVFTEKLIESTEVVHLENARVSVDYDADDNIRSVEIQLEVEDG